MPLLSFILVLVLVGIALWAINNFVAPIMDGRVVTILNYAVIVATILWVLSVLGLFDSLAGLRIGRLR